MKLVELARSSHRCCSSLNAVGLAAQAHVVHWQIHAGLAPDTTLVELGLNSHQYLSFARLMNSRSCCADSAKLISVQWGRQKPAAHTEEPW